MQEAQQNLSEEGLIMHVSEKIIYQLPINISIKHYIPASCQIS